MGVTCHWIDACAFERSSVALACRPFVGSHTCDGVAQLIYVIHYDLGLTHDKIVATTSDNGSNFVKAFRVQCYYFSFQKYYSEGDQDKEKMLSKLVWLWSLWF